MFTLTIDFTLLASGNWRLCDIRELEHHHFGGENLGEQCSRYLGHKRFTDQPKRLKHIWDCPEMLGMKPSMIGG